MKYKDGQLILNHNELKILKFTLMNESIENTFDANEFMDGILDVLAQLRQMSHEYESVANREEREEIVISLIAVTIKACEAYLDLAQDAAKQAGASIVQH